MAKGSVTWGVNDTDLGLVGVPPLGKGRDHFLIHKVEMTIAAISGCVCGFREMMPGKQLAPCLACGASVCEINITSHRCPHHRAHYFDHHWFPGTSLLPQTAELFLEAWPGLHEVRGCGCTHCLPFLRPPPKAGVST